MTSLSFPDVNVWLALMLEDHIHRRAALRWWQNGLRRVAFGVRVGGKWLCGLGLRGFSEIGRWPSSCGVAGRNAAQKESVATSGPTL
jgi:hypothetical protein